MIIKSLNTYNDNYVLTKKTLRATTGVKFYIKLNDLKKHNGRSAQLYAGFQGPGYFIRVSVTNSTIGCRTFRESELAKVFKAAGIKKEKA